MKNLIHLGKKWLRNSPGFTLAELMVAMAVGSFVMGGVFAVWTQLFGVTATNSNYMAAFRQVQNGGDWISRDALMAQKVDPDDDPGTPGETELVTLEWTDWLGARHRVVYTLEGQFGELGDLKELNRSYYIWDEDNEEFDPQNSVLIAEAVDPARTYSDWDYDEKQLTVVITARMGGYVLGKHGVQSDAATRTYRIHPRPFF